MCPYDYTNSIYLAGLLVNYLTINLIQLVNINMIHSDILSNCFIFFSYAMWWNLIPVLNSDGYKILITIFNIEELENKRKNHILVKLIQVIGVILAIRSVMLWFV
ncbi:membrane-embedded metalloprotease [Bacillus cytotoxicus NVH 391-98]|uniref:Membrane-embedded metalloprotease n=1 Tax=Bacillus cytotoxicus (strain DSM 22905 / CIP 110041 / 391-98 / NVH 391-98) TaxID=315749 RepID=A7GQ19_BACCN|nr:membrane-embedded metalloprotease [Bacillus cytotoxicus NVH 391-98]